MLDRATLLTPARIGRLIVGFAAATTSSLMVAWMPLSLLGRLLVFVGSGIVGGVLAGWAANDVSAARAVGKSVLAGAIQANVAGGGLAILATAIDTATGLGPSSQRLSTAFALAVATLIIGSFVGAAIGLAYGFVPAFVAASSRAERSHASSDRVMIAAASWLFGVGGAHWLLVRGSTSGASGYDLEPIEHALLAATWAGPLAAGVVVLAVALLRAELRRALVRRIRKGTDRRYRIVEVDRAAVAEDALPLVGGVWRDECQTAVVRIAEPKHEEVGYREAATPEPPPRAVALLP